MKKRASALILPAALLLGLALLLYPTVSDYWNSLHQSRAIAHYARAVADTGAERTARLLEQARQYNCGIADTGQDFFLSGPALEEYERTLDVDGTGIMGYIEIDSIGCSLPIYHGTDEAVLQVAVGHIPGTALPVGGESTHCVLSGHRGLPSARLFTDLDRLSEGDVFSIRTLNEVLTYEVESTAIVLPSDVSGLALEPGADLCTLVTCTPYGVNSHRLLVRGRRTAGRRLATIRVAADALVMDRAMTALLFAAPLLLGGMFAMTADNARRARRRAAERKLGL